MKSVCPSSLFTETEKNLLLDVREKFEFDTYRAIFSHQINIPFSEFDDEINSISKNQKIILVCNNGLRSRTAAQFLKERGFHNVSYINGGLVKWQQNDLGIAGNPPDLISHSLSLTKECSSQ